MVDTKITDLTEDTDPILTDLVATIDDPSGTPLSKKATVANLLKAINTASDITALATGDRIFVIDDPAGTPVAKYCTPEEITEYAVNNITETAEIWIPAGAFTSSTTNGAAITSRETTGNTVNYTYAAFDTTTSESIWFTWTPPANWNAGTVRFKLYWTNTAGLTTETIDFDLAAVAFANDNPIDTALGSAANVTDTWLAQGDLHITDYSSAITIAGSPAAGEEVHFKLSRDVVSDNLTGDCDVIGIQLEYTVTKIGTT